MNGYISLYRGQRLETHADTLYAAHLQALEHFRPPKSRRHEVSTVLAEKDGKPVVHVAVD